MAKQVRPPSGRLKNSGQNAANNMVIMAEHSAFIRSFDALFAEGMALADKVTADFDRSASVNAVSAMPAEAVEFYARERKKLGAAALKMAAWLWVERAVREGDISAEAAAKEKERLNFVPREKAPQIAAKRAQAKTETETAGAARFARLPSEFRKLHAEIEHFIERIRLMDKEISRRECGAAFSGRETSPVSRQWRALCHAFGGKRN